MSLPSYPRAADPWPSAPTTGLYPLRPLRIGELLAAGLRVATRHLGVLAPIALVVELLVVGVNVLMLAANGSLQAYAAGDLTRVPTDPTSAQLNDFVHTLSTRLLPAFGLSLLLTLILTPVLAGVVTPLAAQAATTRTGTTAAGLARLRGRIPVLLVVALAVGLSIALGYVLLIVPGVIATLMLLPAGPVAAMEGLGVADTLRRATVVSKGFKGRLLGVSLLIGTIVGGIAAVVGSLLTQLVGGDDLLTRYLVVQVLTAAVAAVLAPWSSAVTAMLYIDIRMRREGLAQALLASTRPRY